MAPTQAAERDPDGEFSNGIPPPPTRKHSATALYSRILQSKWPTKKKMTKASASSMKVRALSKLTLYLAHLLTLIAEYKTWKKNSPFLYDMILG